MKDNKKQKGERVKREAKSRATAQIRLRKHLRRLTDEIIKAVESELHAGSPEAVASHREDVLREILSRFLPRTYDLAKGKIYDAFDGVSDSIDIVVLANNHPKFRNARGEIELLLADGVYCTIELKPDLSDLPSFDSRRKKKPEIWRALSQARSVKRLRRIKSPLLGRQHSKLMEDYSLSVPTHIVTVKVPSLEEITTYVADYYAYHGIPIEEQIDTILVLNEGFLVNYKYPEKIPKQSTDQFEHLLVAFKTDYALIEFLWWLLADVSPESHLTAPFLTKYLGDIQRNKPLIARRTISNRSGL